MLKTLNTRSVKPRKGGFGVSSDNRARHDSKYRLDRSKTSDNKIDDKVDDEIGKKDQKMSKSKKLFKFKKTVRSDFLTSRARLPFTKLRQAFVIALIFSYFNPERNIWVEIDRSGYAIGGVFGQLTSNDLGQWHPVAFFFKKMIPAETRYMTHDGELLAIVEAF